MDEDGRSEDHRLIGGPNPAIRTDARGTDDGINQGRLPRSWPHQERQKEVLRSGDGGIVGKFGPQRRHLGERLIGREA